MEVETSPRIIRIILQIVYPMIYARGSASISFGVVKEMQAFQK